MTAIIDAVVYARYSSHGQREESIEGQLRDGYDYAKRNGIRIVHEYIDRARPGKTDDRPDFQRMIKDSQKKQFQLIIVWKLDRFARNRYDSAHYKNILKKHGVRVVSATEPISDSPEGIMLEGMLESLAEYYSANLSKHVKRGMRENVLKGLFTGGRPPFGYKIEGGRLIAHEINAPIIQYVFARYSDGISKMQIVRELNEKGARNANGKPFTINSMANALRNKKYIGFFEYNGEEVKGVCDALIDLAVFNKVQMRLDTRRHAPAALKARQKYLLQGKGFCGICGAPLVGHGGTSKTGKVHHYYACSNNKKLHTCKKKNEKKGFLEWYVVEQTVEYVLTPERMDYIAERLVEEAEKEFGDSRVSEMEKHIAKIDRDISKAVDASLEVESKTARARYYEKIESLEAQKADIQLDLSRLRLAQNVRYSSDQIKAWLKTFCNGDPLDEAFQERITDVFINSVYVYDDKVVIYYNIKDGQQVSYMEMLESTEDVDDGISGDAPEAGGRVRISSALPRQKTPLIIKRVFYFIPLRRSTLAVSFPGQPS